ncbi:MAG: DMT family transporter [Planktomarina sp.]|nr:EamA family transporter [Planktomarina sp.]MDT1985596.1 DMT family transporter [Planktomarina sp.]MDT2017149.1 DMT family transporter [Planktomarina sp.]MDV3049166.1 DMT family transporter [Planktomarina sp.]
MSVENNTRLGVLLMFGTTFVFAVQDGLSMHLSSTYNVFMVVMVRYWFFAAFVMTISAKKAGGLRKVAQTRQPYLQAFRGILLATEICIMVSGFTFLGLVESLAIFSSYTLIVAAMSGPILGETVGWRRWIAIVVGLFGVLIILKPGLGIFSSYAVIPLVAAFMFALYSLLTRYAARQDSSATSFFWTGVMGCIVMTAVGAFNLQNMIITDWILMLCLCLTGATGHWLLIRCYEVAEASEVQPFTYLQLVFGATIGVLVFGEVIEANVAIGAVLVVAAGLFTLWRARVALT